MMIFPCFTTSKVVAAMCPTLSNSLPGSCQKLQGMAPLASLFAGAGGGAVAHHVGHDAVPPRLHGAIPGMKATNGYGLDHIIW